ncbi:MraY family glycosyltransferase [Ralstonia sp. VS2407]
MINLIVAFALSFVCTMMLVRHAHLHEHFSADWDLGGVQKNHAHPVPRVGGIGIFLGIVSAIGTCLVRGQPGLAWDMALLVICASVAFLAGLIEDLTKKVSPRERLLATMVAGLLASWLLHAWIPRVDIAWVDAYLAIPIVAIVLTSVAVAGLANAVNIIDGFNGLASMVAMLMLLSIAYVAFQVGDVLVLTIAFAVVGAILGFFIWNYPAGTIFLGDGGAYLIGFMMAELSVLVIMRNPTVSAWYPVLMFIYPIFETLFSIYRRRVLRGRPAGYPDGVHLHTLVYKRLMRWAIGSRDAKHLLRRNSMTAPYLWLLSLLAVIPATIFWNNRLVLNVFTSMFVVVYVWLYWSIVRFKSPRWMIIKKGR